MPPYDQIQAFFSVLLAVCAAITCAGGALAVVQRVRKPGRDMAATVDHHAACLDRDNKRIADLEDSNRLMLRAQMQLITHEIDGNHVDKLIEVRDAMERFLIER